MDNIRRVIKTICIGLLVAIFLQNTGRALQAIELCKECLISLVNNKPRFRRPIYKIVTSLPCGSVKRVLRHV